MKQCIQRSNMYITLNSGKNIEADAKIYIEHDSDVLSVIQNTAFDSEAQKRLFIERLDDGSLEILTVHVVVSFAGMDGTNSVSSIVVDSLEDLISEIQERELLRLASEDLRNNVHKLLKAVS